MKTAWVRHPDMGSRDRHIFDVCQRSYVAGGGQVVAEREADAAVVCYDAPGRESLKCCDQNVALVSYFFDIAETLRDKFSVVRSRFRPPIDASLIKLGSWCGKHLEPVSSFRLWTVVTDFEIGSVFPLCREFIAEYRSTDPVILVILACMSPDPVRQQVTHAMRESMLQETRLPRIVVIGNGRWSADDVGGISAWGDACLLPWSSCALPVEAYYALAAGKTLVGSSHLLSRHVSSRAASILDCKVIPTEFGDAAEPDWKQLGVMMRTAVANGCREKSPAKREGLSSHFEIGHMYEVLRSGK